MNNRGSPQLLYTYKDYNDANTRKKRGRINRPI